MKIRPGINAAILLSAVALAGCSTRGGRYAYNPTNFRAPTSSPTALPGVGYRLSPGDIVTVTVYELPSVSGDRTVGTRGAIDMPLLGMVAADGLTVAQLGDTIANQLRASYLQAPHVVVTVKAEVQRTVTVDGAVKHPGIFQVPTRSNLLQIIALAEGVTQDANPRRIVVFRTIAGKRAASAFDLVTIRSGKDANPTIYPNDTVVVDGSTLSVAYRALLRTIPLATFLIF